MVGDLSFSWIYLLVLVGVIGYHLMRRRTKHREAAAALQEAIESGLTEPPSLHPVIDPELCVGSATCVTACPEDALGMIANKAVLVNAAHCIGHGACAVACPVQAIKLVFGTEKRGIDIPNVKPNFESNVDGIFIAGELGGMGLIRKAAEQGRQAVESIKKRPRRSGNVDVIIVGAGPAGLSAGLSAIANKLRYKIIEQEDSLGGSVYHYPRNKIAMTAPVELALIGKVKMGEISKENLLAFWQSVIAKTGLKINFKESMETIERAANGFVVKTSKAQYAANSVLLAIGRRGSPRRLDVDGEDLPKVVYRLIDAEQYRGMSVLVVGGGDSALEAAIALSEQPKTDVTLSYRSGAFGRVKTKNRLRLEEQQRAKRVRVMLESQVKSIDAETVSIAFEGKTTTLKNDAVIICAGGVLPTPLLQKIGIEFETKKGTR